MAIASVWFAFVPKMTIDDGARLSMVIETALQLAPSITADRVRLSGFAGPVVSRSQAERMRSVVTARLNDNFRMGLLCCRSRAKPIDHACRHMGRQRRILFSVLLQS